MLCYNKDMNLPKKIYAIDPGPKLSHFVEYDLTYGSMSGISNKSEFIVQKVRNLSVMDVLAIEKPICRRHSGAEVSDTAIMAGTFVGAFGGRAMLISRQKVLGVLCSGRGNDSTVRKAVIDILYPQYSRGDTGPLAGITEDLWQAAGLAIAVEMILQGA